MPRSRWNWPLVPLCHWPSDKKLSKAVGSTDVCCWIYGTLAVNVFSNGSPKSENSPLSLPALIPSKPPFLSALARPTEHHLGLVTRTPCLHWFFSGAELVRAYDATIADRG